MKKSIQRILCSVLALLVLVSICPSALAYSTVRSGSSGTDVRTLQTMLNKVSGAGLSVDGVFGANTQAALKRYQSANGLTADGIAGSQTWAKLSSQYNAGWEIQMPSSVSVEKGKSAYIDIKFRGSGINSYGGKNSNSSAVGATFSNTQWKPAGEWCSVRLNLTGKATGSATVTFTLYGSVTLSNSITINVTQTATNLVDANLSKTAYIKQGSKTCKATAAAMTLNLLTGKNSYTTSGLGGSNFVGIQGKSYVGSDGKTYVATSKADSYVGTATEQKTAIDKAIADGLPIVVAVHSTRSGYTKHHWVIIVGKSGNDYLIVDPASGNSGSMAANVKTMSSANYAFGLTDYSTPHYGYISFTRK